MESTSGGNPLAALIGVGMIVQLILVVGMMLGGIYVLYCLGRAAAGLDRLATAVEALVLDKIKTDQPSSPASAPVQFAIPPMNPVPTANPASPTIPAPPPSPFQQEVSAGEPQPTNPAELGPPNSATIQHGDTPPRL